MTEKVTAANIGRIANPAFRDYARRYVDVEEGFREASAFGVPFAEPSGEKEREAAVEGLSLDVHYCSVESKHTGQVYRQNAPHAARYPLCRMSGRDHFLKSAKVFGGDRAPVSEILRRGEVSLGDDEDFDFTEFPSRRCRPPARRPSRRGARRQLRRLRAPRGRGRSERAAPRCGHPVDLRLREGW